MKILGNALRLCYLNKLMDYISNDFLILEIGSFMGSSLWTMAEGLYRNNKQGKIISIEPFDNFFKKIKSDFDESAKLFNNIEVINEFYKTIYLIKKQFNIDVIHIKGYSFEIMDLLKEKSFDLIYIDGDHSYESVKKDILLAKKLLKKDGIICGDDLEYQYEDLISIGINPYEVKDFYSKKINNLGYHPGVSVAVYEEFKKVKNYYGFWITKEVNLNLSKENIPSHITLFDIIKSYILTPHKIFNNYIFEINNFKNLKGYIYPYNTVAKQIIERNIVNPIGIIDQNLKIKNARNIKNETIFITSFKYLEKILNEIDENNEIFYIHWENLKIYKINKKEFNNDFTRSKKNLFL